MSEMEDGSFLAAYREALHRSGLLAAEEKNLEGERKRVLSSLIAGSSESVTKAEHTARAHRDVQALDDALAIKRIALAGAAAEAKYMETRYEIWRTRSATYRAEMGQR